MTAAAGDEYSNPIAPDSHPDSGTTFDQSYLISLVRQLLETSTSPGKRKAKSAFDDDGPDDDRLADPGESGISTEEAGCILWDLTASEVQANFLVQEARLPEVALGILTVSPFATPRLVEITLGILGNLGCHPGLPERLAATSGMIPAVLGALMAPEQSIPCLMEACRLLGVACRREEGAPWRAAVLGDEDVLAFLLYVLDNSLSSTLLERCLELLLTLAFEDPHRAIPALSGLGLPPVLVGVLQPDPAVHPTSRAHRAHLQGDTNVQKVAAREGGAAGAVLDVAARLLEALTVDGGMAMQLAGHRPLVDALGQLAAMGDDAASPSASTAAVIVLANLADVEVGGRSPITEVVMGGAGVLRGVVRVLKEGLEGGREEASAEEAAWAVLVPVAGALGAEGLSAALAADLVDSEPTLRSSLESLATPREEGGGGGEGEVALLRAAAGAVRALAVALERWAEGRQEEGFDAPQDTSKDSKEADGDWGLKFRATASAQRLVEAAAAAVLPRRGSDSPGPA